MPVLDGDRFVALVDPAMDRANGRLLVRGVHAAPGTTATAEVWRSVAGAVGSSPDGSARPRSSSRLRRRRRSGTRCAEPFTGPERGVR